MAARGVTVPDTGINHPASGPGGPEEALPDWVAFSVVRVCRNSRTMKGSSIHSTLPWNPQSRCAQRAGRCRPSIRPTGVQGSGPKSTVTFRHPSASPSCPHPGRSLERVHIDVGAPSSNLEARWLCALTSVEDVSGSRAS